MARKLTLFIEESSVRLLAISGRRVEKWDEILLPQGLVSAGTVSDEAKLAWLFDRRTREHAINAYDLLLRPEAIRARAGTGQREGYADAGPIQVSLP